MTKFTPLAADAGSTSIGKLTAENGTDRIALYGSLDLTRDRQGLAHARVLRAILDQAVQFLEAQEICSMRCPPRRPRPSPTRSIETPADVGADRGRIAMRKTARGVPR